MIESKTQDDLFARLAAGQRSALEEVCTRYGARVAAFVRRRMGQGLRARLETQDLVQESLAAVGQSASGLSFRGEQHFLGWLRGVVEKKVLHHARHWAAERRAQGREVPWPSVERSLRSGAERPSQVFRRRETLDRLAAELKRLSPADRDLVLLRLFFEVPWATAARILGTTQAAAQMRLTRARRLLRQRLA
jgi:RNA polymerase sigma-70 factor (ECF subfamily)